MKPKVETPKQAAEPDPDPRWDRKQGKPKDGGMTSAVEQASSRYSASEQSEKKLRERKDRSGG